MIHHLGGFFDTNKCALKNLSDVTYIVSCDPPSSGRTVISQRLLRQYCIFALPGTIFFLK